MRRSNTFIAVIFLLAGSLLFLFGLTVIEPGADKPGDQGAAAGLTPLETPSVDYGNPQIGPADAAVTIVEFGDYFCEPCATMAPDLARIVADYAGRVRLVWKDLPNEQIHPGSAMAAEAARCAGIQGAFWEYHDALLAVPPVSGLENHVTLAATLGLEPEGFRGCLAQNATAATVRRDFEEGLRLRLDGTPYLFVNGRRVSGAVSYDQLKTLVDAALTQ